MIYCLHLYVFMTTAISVRWPQQYRSGDLHPTLSMAVTYFFGDRVQGPYDLRKLSTFWENWEKFHIFQCFGKLVLKSKCRCNTRILTSKIGKIHNFMLLRMGPNFSTNLRVVKAFLSISYQHSNYTCIEHITLSKNTDNLGLLS